MCVISLCTRVALDTRSRGRSTAALGATFNRDANSMKTKIGSVVLLLTALPASGGTPQLDKAVAAWAKSAESPTYRSAFADLNNDATPDAVVLIADPRYCGSGGCSMAVFEGIGTEFKLVSSSTITREPVFLLDSSRFGWRSLAVRSSGGGEPIRQVLMEFDGSRYPLNPSLQATASDADLKNAISLTLE
jgi:hypothetical protein